MRKISFAVFAVLFFTLAACMQKQQHESENKPSTDLQEEGYFGARFDTNAAIPASAVPGSFDEGKNMAEGLVVAGYIPASCTHSGCWMDIELAGGETMNVTFRDGEFTIPLDAAGNNAVMTGTAYREMVPAERLRAYARDEGKSEEEIAAITKDGWEYTFVADGVFLK